MVVRMKVLGEMQNIRLQIDRGAIFNMILKRQALRREAQLPLLDIHSEYHRAVEQALWRQHVELHHDRVRADILAQQRARHGQGWGLSWGGQFGLSLLTHRALQASFRKG